MSVSNSVSNANANANTAASAGVGQMLRLGLTLAIYATAACVGLAFVYAGTAAIIEERARADQAAALKELFPDADDTFPAIGEAIVTEPGGAVTVEDAWAVLRDGRVVGVAARTSRGSYGGAIRILVGVEAVPGSGTAAIAGVKILEHSDTPGLGANAASDSYYVDRASGLRFYEQFTGKAVTEPFEPKADVAAITAATITSRAVADSVRTAGLLAAAWLEEHAGEALLP